MKLAKALRVGGLLSGKAGILHLHMGDGKHPFEPIYEAVRTSELSFKQFYPTHINRNAHIFEDAKQYGKQGYVDITTSSYPYFPEEEVKPSKAVAGLLEAGVPPAHITMTSDAGGSLPGFDEQGKLIRLEIGQSSSLLHEVRDLIFEEKLPLSDALRTVTANPAAILKLPHKGYIAEGKDADLVLLDEACQIRHVLANGSFMIRDAKVVKQGSFESSGPSTLSSPGDHPRTG